MKILFVSGGQNDESFKILKDLEKLNNEVDYIGYMGIGMGNNKANKKIKVDIKEALSNKNYDIISIHEPRDFSRTLTTIKTDVPIVPTLYKSDFENKNFLSKLLSPLNEFFLGLVMESDYVTVYSEDLKKKILDQYHGLEKKDEDIIICNNGKNLQMVFEKILAEKSIDS